MRRAFGQPGNAAGIDDCATVQQTTDNMRRAFGQPGNAMQPCNRQQTTCDGLSGNRATRRGSTTVRPCGVVGAKAMGTEREPNAEVEQVGRRPCDMRAEGKRDGDVPVRLQQFDALARNHAGSAVEVDVPAAHTVNAPLCAEGPPARLRQATLHVNAASGVADCEHVGRVSTGAHARTHGTAATGMLTAVGSACRALGGAEHRCTEH
jgi:hypothetical protein